MVGGGGLHSVEERCGEVGGVGEAHLRYTSTETCFLCFGWFQGLGGE